MRYLNSKETSYQIKQVALVLLVLVVAVVVFVPQEANARNPNIAITPAVIDTEAMARDILKYEVTIKNNDTYKVQLYPTVNNISTKEGQQEFLDSTEADRSTSLANWIWVSRGVQELMPGEEKVLDVEIHVDMRAEANKYYAAISFPEGSNRVEAERNLATAPKVMVNLDVVEDIKENVELGKFVADKRFFTGSSASFSLQLNNNGNQLETPGGEIRIFDRRGAEIDTVEINPEKLSVAAGESLDLSSAWEEAKSFGRYKAHLVVTFGSEGTERVQDTVYFYVVPKLLLIGIMALLGIVLMLVIYTVFIYPRRHEAPEFLPDRIEELYEQLPWHHHHARLQGLYERHLALSEAFAEAPVIPEDKKQVKHIESLKKEHYTITEEIAHIANELAMYLPWHTLEEDDAEEVEAKSQSKKKKTSKAKSPNRKTKTQVKNKKTTAKSLKGNKNSSQTKKASKSSKKK